jgi:hypothetical protein
MAWDNISRLKPVKYVLGKLSHFTPQIYGVGVSSQLKLLFSRNEIRYDFRLLLDRVGELEFVRKEENLPQMLHSVHIRFRQEHTLRVKNPPKVYLQESGYAFSAMGAAKLPRKK